MRGKIIHYNATDGRGLVATDERQLAFDIGQWRSELAPAINQTVEFVLDDQQHLASLKLVDAQTMAKERLNQFANSAGGQSQLAAAQGAAVLQQLRERMGLASMVAATVLFLAWFLLPALSVSMGMGIGHSFSVSDLLGLQLSQMGADSSFGFWALLGLVAVALPWLTPWLRSRRASLLNAAPLVMLAVAFLRVRWQVHAAATQAIDAAGALGGAQAQAMAQGMLDQMSAQVSQALSFGIGFWLVLLLGLALAVLGMRRSKPSSRPSAA